MLLLQRLIRCSRIGMEARMEDREAAKRADILGCVFRCLIAWQ